MAETDSERLVGSGLVLHFRQAASFGAVGAINTLLGYGVIYLCMLGLGWSAVASNLAGYAVGLCCSFLLNRRLTFRSDGAAPREARRFLTAFAVAYLLNFAMLLASIHLLGIPAVWSQVVSGIAYTGAFFVLSKWYVFRPQRRLLAS